MPLNFFSWICYSQNLERNMILQYKLCHIIHKHLVKMTKMSVCGLLHLHSLLSSSFVSFFLLFTVFLTLKIADIAFNFGISPSAVGFTKLCLPCLFNHNAPKIYIAIKVRNFCSSGTHKYIWETDNSFNVCSVHPVQVWTSNF